ncbi:MAG: hypothetical protein ACT4OI_02055 [Methanobacteriota archaeon]
MPAKRRSFVAVVRAAERSLRAAGIDHVFVGALAVAAFGVPRTTADVDVIADYREGDAPGMADAFRAQGFRVSPEDLRDAAAERSHCTVHDAHSEFHVDLAPAARPVAKDAIRHAVRVRWRGTMLPIADPEHTIVMKLVYGSEQDVEDALGIYVRQKKRLDVRGMRRFAGRQGVLTALRELERKAVE